MIGIDTSELKTFAEELGGAGPILDSSLSQGLTIAGAQIQSAARALVPVDTGALRLSISSDLISTTQASIGPTQPYGKDIEMGRTPPVDVTGAQLMGWAKRKGLNPWAVAASIRKNGTKAQPYLFPAADAQADNVTAILGQAVANAFITIFK